MVKKVILFYMVMAMRGNAVILSKILNNIHSPKLLRCFFFYFSYFFFSLFYYHHFEIDIRTLMHGSRAVF